MPRVASGSTQAAQWARELEAELADYPEERGQILLEAGDWWHRGGNHERAIELLTQAIAAGGEDGGHARVTLAEVLFDLDRPEQAWAELSALRAQRPPSPSPYHQAAELLEHRDDLDQALTWINMAVARLTEQEMAPQRQESGLFSYANHVLAGRRRIREKLQLPTDDLDNSVLSSTNHYSTRSQMCPTGAASAPQRRPRCACCSGPATRSPARTSNGQTWSSTPTPTPCCATAKPLTGN